MPWRFPYNSNEPGSAAFTLMIDSIVQMAQDRAKSRGCSLLALLGLLLLILLVSGSLHLLESAELLDKESLHDLLTDLSAGENATVGSGDGSLSGSELSELRRSSDLDTLHTSASSVLTEDVHDELATGGLDRLKVVGPGSVATY